MPLALLALAIGAFGIGTTEFVITGLLPEVSTDFGVSILTAGYLVSGYALGVVLGAPLMSVLGTRISRKRMRGRPATLRSSRGDPIAYTALQLNAPTADPVDAVQPGGPFHTLPTVLDRPLLFIAGGVPVRRGGRLIGAIGVGGGAPEQDHGFATEAVEALDR
ncbi:MFS transporter [Streptomyces spiramyceticus]|uniref:MFS transporter n=1 Tax=Streptomyces spiramyceticus TaxID=299717 RepID=UPI00237C3D73|nr:MFS transporter [Streptomyces spiramyceticus]